MTMKIRWWSSFRYDVCVEEFVDFSQAERSVKETIKVQIDSSDLSAYVIQIDLHSTCGPIGSLASTELPRRWATATRIKKPLFAFTSCRCFSRLPGTSLLPLDAGGFYWLAQSKKQATSTHTSGLPSSIKLRQGGASPKLWIQFRLNDPVIDL